MNAKPEQATAHDADGLAMQLTGEKQRRARAIAAAMRNQEKRIRELEAALLDKATIAHALSKKAARLANEPVWHDKSFDECEICTNVRDLLSGGAK